MDSAEMTQRLDEHRSWLGLRPANLAAQAERLERLGTALEALPEAQRRAVALRYLDGLPVARVAERMGKTAPAVAGLLFRGLEALHAAMGDEP